MHTPLCSQVGLIVCLCTRRQDGSSTIPGNRPIRNKTTAEWVEFVQGLEDESLITEFEGIEISTDDI